METYRLNLADFAIYDDAIPPAPMPGVTVTQPGLRELAAGLGLPRSSESLNSFADRLFGSFVACAAVDF